MRRTRGTGCITPMKEGRYKYRGLIRIGVNKNGNPKNKVFYGNTKKEVEDKIYSYLHQDEPELKEVIVFNDALDLLFEQSKKERVKQKTLSIIETTSKILRRQWGENAINNIFVKEVEEQFLIWEEEYSFSQLQKLRNYGKKAFRLICEKYDVGLKNPFDLKLKSPDEAPRYNCFSEEEIYAINKQMKGKYEDIPLFLYETGLRINECLALKFEDIDYENRVITINKTLSETKQKNGKYQISVTTPKTQLSYRKVPLTKVAKDIVFYRDQGFANDDALVFPSGANTYLSARNVLRAFDIAIEKAGIAKKHRGLHSIRHATVVRLFKEMAAKGRNREIDAIDISKIIGNRVDVSAYLYDLEQVDRANRIRMVLEESEKSTYIDEPNIKSGMSKEMLDQFHIEFAAQDVESALELNRITTEEKELFKKYAFRCYRFVFEDGELDYPIAGQQLCDKKPLWEMFKQTGKFDVKYINSIRSNLETYESFAETKKYRKLTNENKRIK